MSSQIQITGETKVKSLTGVLVGTTGVVSSLAFDVAGGVPKLDANAKILVSQLPNSVMEYQGTWNAATNTPTLVNGTGNQGDVYLCNVAGTVNFGAGPIAFVVGDQVIYSGSIWQRASGSTGTVTSVAVTESGDSLNITGSPITTSGTINIGFNGTNLQYVNGAGNLTTFPTLITSIGLSMPSAFSVANSPLTANGTIAVTGAGVASQYIRGDGTLANFPTSGGGGSSVAYYFNSSVSQGTLGGVAYRELSKVPIIGAGTDITIATNGYIANYITDAGDPSLLEIPAGNWNFEMFFSASSNGGSPSFYVELYKYDGTTFTLISSSSATPEGITNGTAIDLYTTALAVPLTTLTLTDRLAIRVYVNNSSRTITLHTENSHLCEVITTFSTGIAALNGLTAQVQYFQTGTSGTDFNISSTTATHTFNIPDASATARGLITTGTQTIAGAKTFSGLTSFTNTSGINLQYGAYINKGNTPLAFSSNNTNIYSDATTNNIVIRDNSSIAKLLFNNSTQTFTFPAATGTIALTSDIPSITGLVPYTGATGAVTLGVYELTSSNLIAGGTSGNAGMLHLKSDVAITSKGNGYTSIGAYAGSGIIQFQMYTGAATYKSFTFSIGALTDNTNRQFTLPNATGTLALTTDLSAYLPLTGGTLTGALSGTSATFSGNILIQKSQPQIQLYQTGADHNYSILGNTSTALEFWWGTFGSNTTKMLSLAASTGAATFSGNVGLGAISSYAKFNISTGDDNQMALGTTSVGQTVGIYLADGPTTSSVGYKWEFGKTTANNFFIYSYGTASNVLSIAYSTGAATFSSSVTAGGGNFVVHSNGNASIGNPTQIGTLYIAGDTTIATNANIGSNGGYMTLQKAGGNVLIGTTSNATGLLQVNGTIYATGFYESSDIRFKNILETNPNINLSAIDVIKFTRKDNDINQVRYGYSAQQVQSILPDAVTGTDFLNVNYLDVHTLKIAQLEKEIKELKAKLN